MYRKKSVFIRLIAIMLISALILPLGANATAKDIVQPRASLYLSMYGAYVYAAGGGEIQVYFDVEGTGYMDELGSLSIEIFECTTNSNNIQDWTWKETYKHNTTSGMLSYNDDYHSGHVDYNGIAGRWYKAYVCVWAGEDGDGDTRYFWTYAEQAI